MINFIMIYALFFHVWMIDTHMPYIYNFFKLSEKIYMINHQYTLERGRQADQSRSMSTPSIKTGDLPRKDKVCLQPVKTNIVISYNIYDFDWYVQVTSFVCFKIPTARDNKQKRRKLYCWRCWRRWRLIKTILACSKSAKTVSSSELTLICLGQKQIIVRKPKSNTLTISVWQKTKKQPQTYKFTS